MSQQIGIMGIVLGIPAILGWILRSYLNHKRFMRVAQLKAELNTKLLDKLGTDPQAIEFFKGDVQKELLEIRLPEPQLPSAYARMLTSVQFAAVLLSAGVACLWLRGYLYSESDQDSFLFLGTVGVALGVGALLSAVSAYVIGRMWETSRRDDKARAGI